MLWKKYRETELKQTRELSHVTFQTVLEVISVLFPVYIGGIFSIAYLVANMLLTKSLCSLLDLLDDGAVDKPFHNVTSSITYWWWIHAGVFIVL